MATPVPKDVHDLAVDYCRLVIPKQCPNPGFVTGFNVSMPLHLFIWLLEGPRSWGLGCVTTHNTWGAAYVVGRDSPVADLLEGPVMKCRESPCSRRFDGARLSWSSLHYCKDDSLRFFFHCIFQTCLKKKETHQSFKLKKDTISKNISKITETFNWILWLLGTCPQADRGWGGLAKDESLRKLSLVANRVDYRSALVTHPEKWWSDVQTDRRL